MRKHICASALGFAVALAVPLTATPIFFSTGSPDGRIGTASRPASPAGQQIETADDFVLSQAALLNAATFTGLLPSGAPLTNISQVEIEFYHVFPLDSVNPPSGKVPTRVNSPADVEIGSATRDSANASLGFGASLLNPNFTVANSVINGIHPVPNQKTEGEGPATGEEVLIDVTFNTPVELAAGHYFFRPEALLNNGTFLWLSAPRPIVSPGTPFKPDLQSWIRNDALAPDWLRVGMDIVGGTPAPTFNASFSLSGEAVPEPATFTLVLGGLALAIVMRAYMKRHPLT
jgi:hypothetical protein